MKLIKGQKVICKINNKEVECEVINATYETGLTTDKLAEVRMLSSTFAGYCAVVSYNDLVVKNEIKGSAAIEFGKYVNDDNEKRFLKVDIKVKSNNLDNAVIILDNIIDNMESQDSDICFNLCPAEYEYDNLIIDGFILEYEHGSMTDLKGYIKDMFKTIKLNLGIR